MSQWMCRYTRLDEIKNEDIQDKVRVTLLEDKMSEARLRWLGHVMRRCVDTPL